MNFVNGGSHRAARRNGFDLRSVDGARSVKAKPWKADTLVLIDGRTLERECFVRCIEMSHPRVTVSGYSSVREWSSCSHEHPEPTAILLNIGARRVSDPAVGAELEPLIEEAQPTPVIVLAESEDLREMIAAVDRGARGYIPASVGFDVIVEATRLTSAGGMFLPVASVLSMRDAFAPKLEPSTVVEGQFTARQTAVAHALVQGKANKIIAYELDMSESTVKVHIRNIMKKLRTTNRTEAALKLNSLFARDGG